MADHDTIKGTTTSGGRDQGERRGTTALPAVRWKRDLEERGVVGWRGGRHHRLEGGGGVNPSKSGPRILKRFAGKSSTKFRLNSFKRPS